MSSVITPMQYKTLPWKNGQGQTTEMAIDDNGTLDCFDWRISSATVANDGEFSDFSGYQRHMVLLEGKGLSLHHDNGLVDNLMKPLDAAGFDGSCKTEGKLKDGAITNFNLITRTNKFEVTVNTYQQRTTVDLPQDQLCFVYCLDAEAIVRPSEMRLPPIHLLVVTEEDNHGLSVTGERMIVACLKRLL